MGDIWKFSDKIDEEDLAFAADDYITYEMAVQYYGLGLKAVTRIAWESGAVYKLGRRKVLIRREIFEECLRQQYLK